MPPDAQAPTYWIEVSHRHRVDPDERVVDRIEVRFRPESLDVEFHACSPSRTRTNILRLAARKHLTTIKKCGPDIPRARIPVRQCRLTIAMPPAKRIINATDVHVVTSVNA